MVAFIWLTLFPKNVVMTQNGKGRRSLIYFSLAWSVVSLILQATALLYSQWLMQTTLGWFFPEVEVCTPLLVLFRIVLSLLVINNIIVLFLWKKELDGNRFLWFIGLNYSAFLLFILGCLSLLANILINLEFI